jgi:hypothetical protein
MKMSEYIVEVQTCVGTWTEHSRHASYRDAVDQADMVHGRVMVGDGETSDRDAWRYAVAEQGYDGDFAAWQSQDDDARDAYEAGARRDGTV